MVNQAYPTLQDYAPSWADIKTTITPYGASLIDTFDYAAINVSSALEIGVQRGASGGRVMKDTTGELTHEGTITFFRSGLRRLQRGLMGAAPQRGNQRLIALVKMDILIQHTPPDEVEIYELKLKGLRLKGFTWAMAQGPDADQVEVPVFIKEIVEIVDGQEIVLI